MTKREVSQAEYHAHFMHKDAVLSLTGNYPYTCEWRMRGNRNIIAMSTETDKDEQGNRIYPTIDKYYIID